jgi:drug/metabolite transporter (DMT)-like permease
MTPSIGLVLAVLASVLWGLTYCLDERVLESISVFKLYFLHCCAGALVSAAILVAQGHAPATLFRIDTKTIGLPLVAVTLVTATAAALAILASIQALGASKSAVLEISYPLFVALFSWGFFGGHLQPAVVVGGAFIFVGAAIISMAK